MSGSKFRGSFSLDLKVYFGVAGRAGEVTEMELSWQEWREKMENFQLKNQIFI